MTYFRNQEIVKSKMVEVGIGEVGLDSGNSLCEDIMAGETMASLRPWNEASMAELSWRWRETGIGHLTQTPEAMFRKVYLI